MNRFAGYDSKYWRGRAEEARTGRAEAGDPEAKATLEKIEAMYDSMASLLELKEEKLNDLMPPRLQIELLDCPRKCSVWQGSRSCISPEAAV